MRLSFQELILQQLLFFQELVFSCACLIKSFYHEIVRSFREYVFSGVLFSRGLYRSHF